MSDEPDIDVQPFKCWCGAEAATYEELFSDLIDNSCGGTGTLHCYCGGDLCICHHHGETECQGCEECGFGEPDGDYDDDE